MSERLRLVMKEFLEFAPVLLKKAFGERLIGEPLVTLAERGDISGIFVGLCVVLKAEQGDERVYFVGGSWRQNREYSFVVAKEEVDLSRHQASLFLVRLEIAIEKMLALDRKPQGV